MYISCIVYEYATPNTPAVNKAKRYENNLEICDIYYYLLQIPQE